MNDNFHEEANRWNRAFDVLKPWQQFHPRTFWQMVEAVAEINAPQPINWPENLETGSTSICDLQILAIR